MPIFVVTYDLKNPNKSYAELFVAIKKNSNQWWHYLPHTWIVSTNNTSDKLAKSLLPFIERNDRLLVQRLARDHQGWLPREAWDWLEDKDY